MPVLLDQPSAQRVTHALRRALRPQGRHLRGASAQERPLPARPAPAEPPGVSELRAGAVARVCRQRRPQHRGDRLVRLRQEHVGRRAGARVPARAGERAVRRDVTRPAGRGVPAAVPARLRHPAVRGTPPAQADRVGTGQYAGAADVQPPVPAAAQARVGPRRTGGHRLLRHRGRGRGPRGSDGPADQLPRRGRGDHPAARSPADAQGPRPRGDERREDPATPTSCTSSTDSASCSGNAAAGPGRPAAAHAARDRADQAGPAAGDVGCRSPRCASRPGISGSTTSPTGSTCTRRSAPGWTSGTTRPSTAASRTRFETYRYFGLSALGAPPVDGDHLAPAGVHPYRLEDPMLWLLARFGAIKTMKGKR